MIVYLKGKLTDINPTSVIVETNNGIGYLVQITLSTFNKIKLLKETKLLTHFIVKEDSQTLYGFAEDDERYVFTQLISVSGVGPSTARLLLSTLSAQDVRHAIISENIDTLKSAKGIGPKASKRIVLELKDKILKDGGINSTIVAQTLTMNNAVREEALSALVALGFNKSLVQKTLNRVLKGQPDINDSSELIKQALGQLSS
ncbi:MAG: Holliday junction branch migration protein RuvA [Saprospiraceae bacterium]|nr:Holliday junction branch migration protein RuvA [Saprospiraceae bacterium]